MEKEYGKVTANSNEKKVRDTKTLTKKTSRTHGKYHVEKDQQTTKRNTKKQRGNDIWNARKRTRYGDDYEKLLMEKTSDDI